MSPLPRRAVTSRPVRPLHLGLVSLLAAVPLVVGPPAYAGDKKPERTSVCRVPDIDLDYDDATFTAAVTLPASGCASRELRQFVLSAAISRVDNESSGRDLVERSAVCGPFRSADDFESGEEAPQYFCNLAVFDHPEEHGAQYSVDVSYPGASGDRTMSLFTFCTSDETTASCEE